MKNLLLVLFLLCNWLFLLAQPQQFTPASSAEAAGFSSERLSRIDTFYEQMVRDGLAPNAVTFVAHKGQIVHYKTYGYSNLEAKTPLKKDDIFRIVSQTKALTTVALMMLYEQGKFLLEDPVSKYIPAFANTQVLDSFDAKTLEYTAHPPKTPLTIRHLLTHTAGIPYGHPLEKRPEMAGMPYLNSMKKETLADVMPRLAARPLLHEPGEQFTYGVNTDVVGYLVEVLSGQSLAEFVEEHITKPLGMKDTYFYLPDDKASRLVELYAKATPDAPITVSDNMDNRKFPITGAKTYYAGGAGMVSTIEDYAKFCQMLLNGGSFNNHQILSPATVEMMTRNQIGDLEVWDRRDKFGYGFQIFQDISRYGDLAPPGSYMWGGAFCSEYTIDPKNELILLTFTNMEQQYAYYGDFVRKFRVLVYQALEK